VDDHSRYLVCLKACAGQTEATVRGHLETAFRHHGPPDAMFVDNGSPWGGAPAERWTRFGVWLLKLGAGVLHSRPYHPQSRGKNERFHRTLNQEVLSMTSFRGLREAQRAFDAWLPIYNGERPHEALAMAVPADRYRPSPRPMPTRPIEPEYDERDIVRKVGTTKAYIQFKGRSWPVGQAFFWRTRRDPPAWGRWTLWHLLRRASDRCNRLDNKLRCQPCLRTGVRHVPELNT
jgi:hypothetical protein